MLKQREFKWPIKLNPSDHERAASLVRLAESLAKLHVRKIGNPTYEDDYISAAYAAACRAVATFQSPEPPTYIDRWDSTCDVLKYERKPRVRQQIKLTTYATQCIKYALIDVDRRLRPSGFKETYSGPRTQQVSDWEPLQDSLAYNPAAEEPCEDAML